MSRCLSRRDVHKRPIGDENGGLIVGYLEQARDFAAVLRTDVQHRLPLDTASLTSLAELTLLQGCRSATEIHLYVALATNLELPLKLIDLDPIQSAAFDTGHAMSTYLYRMRVNKLQR